MSTEFQTHLQRKVFTMKRLISTIIVLSIMLATIGCSSNSTGPLSPNNSIVKPLNEKGIQLDEDNLPIIHLRD